MILSSGPVLEFPVEDISTRPTTGQRNGKSRTLAEAEREHIPGGVERLRLSSGRGERRRSPPGHQSLHAAVPHEEAGYRPPRRDVG